ncbi:hypothetical protein TanjilG_10910 [Lupinus angustifolius]|uniref:Uncharacterized protein n=1 Tax=Lupinus angustifolius TaxID=3871 RepID=A0A394DFX0_LUPAN|nr:PREDICTED: uncharacterized protein LOC109340601 [Lupinus angustifolius]OIW21794.1 hypothetical protein TanjilG_10910 [Lupinus angustifolius]
MMGLNKLGATITVIIAVSLTALTVEIIYVLWRRNQKYRSGGRIEPQEASPPCSSASTAERPSDLELELQMMKFQHMYAPPRVLFTIKEEEREGLESDNGGSSSDCGAVMVKIEKMVAVDKVAVEIEELLNDATTPFWTPCASPSYYTPYSSPCRETNKDDEKGNG